MRVIGTAGHVDHGKSTLVRRMTGIDPDRLTEEKNREMTIDLGFAWLPMSDGDMVGVVDVPGHRDFIENMLAGVGGIDAVLLVIAADEGVMPQTREHLAILDLLGIEHGLVVLTKIDLVDDSEWLDLVEHDITDVLAVTALAGAEIVRVSSHTGAGILELQEKLSYLLNDLPARADYGQPRLPIDRVFTISGFGTVVTGTLLGGTLRVGEEIELQPTGVRGRIRGLQNYKQSVSLCYPGSRVAVNLTGIEKRAIARGHVLAHPGQIQPAGLVDAYFRHLPDADRPLVHNTPVKVFSGAAETLGRVRLLNDEQLAPGESGWLQLQLETSLPLSRGDRYILRIPSPAQTIGGGIIVDPHPRRRWKRFQSRVIDHLERLLQGTPAMRLATVAEHDEPLRRSELMKRTGFNDAEMSAALQEALDEQMIIALPGETFLAATSYHAMQRHILETLAHFHQAEPLRLGMPREELRSRLGIRNAALGLFLDALADEIVIEETLVRLPDHTVRFDARQQTAVDALRRQFLENPYTPPSYTEAVEIVGEKVLRALIDQGEIVQIQRDMIFTTPVYAEMVQTTLDIIDSEGSIDAKALRDRFNTSRKYAIGLLEHLDSIGVTRRVGDERMRGKRAIT